MTSNKNIRLRIACSIYSGPMTLLIYSSSIILPTWDDFVCVCVCVCVLSYSGCNTPKILHVHKTSLVISCLNKSSLQGHGGCLDWKCSIFATQCDIALNAELAKNNCVRKWTKCYIGPDECQADQKQLHANKGLENERNHIQNFVCVYCIKLSCWNSHLHWCRLWFNLHAQQWKKLWKVANQVCHHANSP